MASTAEKLDPELWEEAKADAREKFGGHSARAMQYAVKLYKERGGRYKGPKKKDNRLTQWTEQDWTTKSGRPSKETGERYLPRDAIAALTPAEYGATTRAKRAGGGVGQSVAQPKSIREKTRKFRKVNPMATAKQIAARKKFAERARSGELAKMRKKSTRKSNPMVISKQADSSLSKYGSRGYLRKMLDDYSDLGHVVAVRKKRTGGVSISLDGGRAMTPEQARKKLEDFFGYATNPTATRAASRKANPITETLIYGLPRGEDRDYMEELLYAGGLKLNNQQVNQVLKAASDAGYHSFRITGFDPTVMPDFGVNVLNRPKRKRNPTATRAPARPRTKLISNGERKKNPATKDVFFVNVIDDGGFQFGMDDRTPVLFKFSNREMKKGVYRSFALPFNVTSNAEFQNFVKSLPGNQIVISLRDLRKQLSAYA